MTRRRVTRCSISSFRSMSKDRFTLMIKNDPRSLVPPPTGSPGSKNLSYPQNLSLSRRRCPESKRTYQIARKKLFSENELADRQSPPAWTIPHRILAVDTPQDDSVNRRVDRIDNSYGVDKLGYSSFIAFSRALCSRFSTLTGKSEYVKSRGLFASDLVPPEKYIKSHPRPIY